MRSAATSRPSRSSRSATGRPSTTCSSRSRPAPCPTPSCRWSTAWTASSVVWISRYNAGGNLFLDLEAVEELTANPEGALDRLIDLLPVTFRADWAARVSKIDGIVYTTEAAPSDLTWVAVDRAAPIPHDDENTIACAARLNKTEIVVIGRRGGPEFLDSEIARLGHLVGLAMSIARAAGLRATDRSVRAYAP